MTLTGEKKRGNEERCIEYGKVCLPSPLVQVLNKLLLNEEMDMDSGPEAAARFPVRKNH